jgi:hypothetical protein
MSGFLLVVVGYVAFVTISWLVLGSFFLIVAFLGLPFAILFAAIVGNWVFRDGSSKTE